MNEFFSLRRLTIDFLGYLVFVFSSFVVFGTDLDYRFLLVPVTFFAFFITLANRFKEAFSLGFDSAEIMYSEGIELIRDNLKEVVELSEEQSVEEKSEENNESE